MYVQDRRVKRTQHLLASALIALTLEKGYDAVTIRDITERADIGYATFFRHYHDKDALLSDVLEVVLTELMALFQAPAADADPLAAEVLFEYVRDHSEICRVLLTSRGSRALTRRVIEAGTARAIEEHKQSPGARVPLEVAAHHIVASSISLIEWWLEHDMRYSPEKMAQIYHDLIARPAAALAFGS